MAIKFEIIPEKKYAAVNQDDIEVVEGQTIGQAVQATLPALIGKSPPAGKKYIISVSIRGLEVDA